jgi:hypothetical protein
MVAPLPLHMELLSSDQCIRMCIELVAWRGSAMYVVSVCSRGCWRGRYSLTSLVQATWRLPGESIQVARALDSTGGAIVVS